MPGNTLKMLDEIREAYPLTNNSGNRLFYKKKKNGPYSMLPGCMFIIKDVNGKLFIKDPGTPGSEYYLMKIDTNSTWQMCHTGKPNLEGWRQRKQEDICRLYTKGEIVISKVKIL